jgi:hypothetical protein
MLDNAANFLSAFTAWAQDQPGILAAALVGSHARRQARPDSDLDLVILARCPQDWINDPGWTIVFGEAAEIQVEDWGRLTSLRVFYHNGLEVEFGITGEQWAALPLDEGTARVIAGGMRILVDKEGLLNRVARVAGAA